MTAPYAERRPHVSFIIAAHNAAPYIETAVRSALEQADVSVEIIVVDDASTDATPDIVARMAQDDARVILVRQPTNAGPGPTRNVAVGHATGDWLAILDADDISLPDRCRRQLAVLNADPSIVATSGACMHIDAAGRELGRNYIPASPAAADYEALPATEPYLLHPFLMVRRDAFLAVGGYRNLFFSEDSDLYWRLREIGTLHNLSEPLGFMRLHHASITNASLQNGRIMAALSQLAAISARRRAEKRADLEFSADVLAHMRKAPSFEAMLEIAGTSLTEEERRYLRNAATAKLLELAAGRLFDIDVTDCRFVRKVYAAIEPRMLAAGSTANWAYRKTLIRMLRRGRFGELLKLLDFKVLGYALALRALDLAAGAKPPATARALPIATGTGP